MFDKINQIKKQMDDIKNRLENIEVQGESPNAKIVVRMNGNRKVKDIAINESYFKTADFEEFQDYLVIAFNKAMENAENVNETEMRSAAGSLLPGFGL